MADDDDPQRKGMDDAAKGMSDQQLKDEYKQINSSKEPTAGNLEAKDAIQKELNRRGIPLP